MIENRLDRPELLNWFFDGHRKEPVCLLREAGTFVGMITIAYCRRGYVKEVQEQYLTE